MYVLSPIDSSPSTAPTAPPQSPSAIAQGSRDIMLTWSPPPPIHVNGIILYYRVRVTERETGQLFPFVTPLQQLPVHDLHPHYYYDCTVAAFTVGDGPFSSNFTVQTAEEREIIIAFTYITLVNSLRTQFFNFEIHIYIAYRLLQSVY